MQKFLILGKNGMLGQAILKAFNKNDSEGTSFHIIAYGRGELDITNKKSVHEKIQKLKPEVVINATGYTNVDGAETEREKAFAVNAEGVWYVAEICAQVKATLFHFSTDYIFDGKEPEGYREDDTAHINPLNVYGDSKRAGELRIENKELNYFIIRTSWLYGAGGKNFVDTLLTRARDGQMEFKVVNDQFGKPTYTGDLAEQVLWLIERRGELKSGIYHCANEINSITHSVAGISWYDFAREIFKQAHELGIIKKAPLVVPCATFEFQRPAKRPQYSVIRNTKLSPMREWKGALRDYLTGIFLDIKR